MVEVELEVRGFWVSEVVEMAGCPEISWEASCAICTRVFAFGANYPGNGKPTVVNDR